MTHSRRRFLTHTAALATLPVVVPFAAQAGGHSPNEYQTADGLLTVKPIRHASIVLESPMGTIFVDPVGEPTMYSGFDSPALIVVTHEHGDHFNVETLLALAKADTPIVVNPGVADKLPASLKANMTVLANGENATVAGLGIEAIPAYNITVERQNFHPQGRDNGYVLSISDKRIYVSGDTEDIPEMRALPNIDIAFVCMNLPFTMDANAAADAVSEFKPSFVYPYHFRGRDGGTQDPQAFADMLSNGIQARVDSWYA